MEKIKHSNLYTKCDYIISIHVSSEHLYARDPEASVTGIRNTSDTICSKCENQTLILGDWEKNCILSLVWL